MLGIGTNIRGLGQQYLITSEWNEALKKMGADKTRSSSYLKKNVQTSENLWEHFLSYEFGYSAVQKFLAGKTMFVSQTKMAEEVPAPAITFILVEPWSKGEKQLVTFLNKHFKKFSEAARVKSLKTHFLQTVCVNL